jgi:hypothetical protein
MVFEALKTRSTDGNPRVGAPHAGVTALRVGYGGFDLGLCIFAEARGDAARCAANSSLTLRPSARC